MQVLENEQRSDRFLGTIARLPKVVGSLGEHQFGRELLKLLEIACGAQHCTLFRMTKNSTDPVVAVSHDGTDTAYRQSSIYASGAYWRRDALMTQVMRAAPTGGTSLGHMDTAVMIDPKLRDHLYGANHIGERILLCGRTENQALGLSILRTEQQGQVTSEEISCIDALSSTLMAILNKHLRLLVGQTDSSLALTSLNEIEMTLRDSGMLFPKREAEVCARILFGITTLGIALDLGIGEETVVTYRKRAYRRLEIGSQRELLVWYLREWSNGHQMPDLALAS